VPSDREDTEGRAQVARLSIVTFAARHAAACGQVTLRELHIFTARALPISSFYRSCNDPSQLSFP